NGGAHDGFEPLDRPPVLQSQTLQTAADKRPLVLGRLLRGLRAEGGQPGWHIARCQKGSIIGIDQSRERGGNLGSAGELLVTHFPPGACPSPTALLDEPESHDVLEQSSRPRHAPLVGEIYRIVSALITGCGTSTPRSDQVPEL